MSSTVNPSFSDIIKVISETCNKYRTSFPPSLLRSAFLRKSKLVARRQGRCGQKASAGKEYALEIPFVLPLKPFSCTGGILGFPNLV
jgi:hypothetical protein